MMSPAQKWGRELRRAVRRRETTCGVVGDAIGYSASSVQNWHAGLNLPPYEAGLAVAELLHWHRLRSLIVELRTKTCERPGCGRAFIAAKSTQRWCSHRCRQYKYWAKKNAKRNERRRKRVGSLLAVWQEVGDRMCREWCPGGREDNVCPDASCPIQEAELCPWPLARGLLEEVA